MTYRMRRSWPAVLTCGVLLAVTWFRPAAAQPPESGASPAKADPYAVPEGTPAELAQFIQRQLSTRPPDAQSRGKAIEAMSTAADRILAGKADQASVQLAVQVKLMFERSTEKLQALADKFQQAGQTKIARLLRGGVLRRQLESAMFNPGEQGVALAQALAEVKKFLTAAPLGPEEIGLAMAAAQLTERTGDDRLALDTYSYVAALCAKSADPQIKALAGQLAPVIRRLKLPGNEMKVEGTLLDGRPLDWAKYRGKVVLVDFWATWCGPCRAQFPLMREAYERYRARGFEILGISIDQDRTALAQFLKEQKLPWPIVHDAGGSNPTAAYYGIEAIPAMILVGADGKVISLRALGPVLQAELEKIFGPAEAKGPGS